MIERRSPNVRILNMRFLLCMALTFLMPLGLLAGEKAREGTEWDTAYWYNANNDNGRRRLWNMDNRSQSANPIMTSI
jgi:hypothetical protein